MSADDRTALALDEMFSPVVARALRDRGHDVVALAEHPAMRAMTDDGGFAWAAGQGRWLLTENVKDFRPIQLHALASGARVAGLLFTSSRAFARSRKNPGPLVEALHAWLQADPPEPPLTEGWLPGPSQ